MSVSVTPVTRQVTRYEGRVVTLGISGVTPPGTTSGGQDGQGTVDLLRLGWGEEWG